MTTPYYADEYVTLWHGRCEDVLRTLPANHVHAVVTDPPYGIEFTDTTRNQPWAAQFTSMNGSTPLPDRQLHVNPRCRTCGGYQRGTKNPCPCSTPEWTDTQAAAVRRANLAFQAWCETWATECFRVMRPGAYLFAFGGTRTWHRLAVAIEDAGLEIRDSLAWLHDQGAPKSDQQFRPVFEPAIVARKPSPRSTSATAARYGTGLTVTPEDAGGYWAPHAALSPGQAAILPAQVRAHIPAFTYHPKARPEEKPIVNGVMHPTVKPLSLMQWLLRRAAPPAGLVLDPFAGSGTTVEAALMQGRRVIAVEREADYIPLVMERIHRRAHPEQSRDDTGQLGLFDGIAL
jgi:DNA modification methylase